MEILETDPEMQIRANLDLNFVRRDLLKLAVEALKEQEKQALIDMARESEQAHEKKKGEKKSKH